MQLKTLETEITKYRKQRRSYNSKLRTLRKNGQELSEVDSAEFDRICGEQAAIQKQIESVRKASRQHNMVFQVRDGRVEWNGGQGADCGRGVIPVGYNHRGSGGDTRSVVQLCARAMYVLGLQLH